LLVVGKSFEVKAVVENCKIRDLLEHTKLGSVVSEVVQLLEHELATWCLQWGSRGS
jgi:hypothetical protein